MGRKAKSETEPVANGDNGTLTPVLTKRERFLKYAARRTNNALKALRNVARMGNTASYEYTEQEVQRITSALQEACGTACESFFAKAKTKESFTL